MRPKRFALVAPLLFCGLAAQSASPTIRIVTPTEGTYVAGPTRIVAQIDPASATAEVTLVTFFADAHQICTVRRPPFECEWHAGERIDEHTFRVVATLRSGTRVIDTVHTRGLSVTEDVDVDVMQITAVVTDSSNRFVRGLTREDFRVFDDGKPQPISHFAAENIPLELVAALDVSSSMREAIDTVKAAAQRFLTELSPSDQVTVLAFNESIFTPARRATDSAARVNAVGRLDAWGGTALYDAIIRAIEILGRQSGRRAIVLFSDGEDQSSHATLETALRATEGSDATIYAIGLGRAVKAVALQKLLERITSVSGGRAFFTDEVGRLDAVFGEILEDLRHQYLLSYAVPDNRRDDEWHTIRLEVAGGRHAVRARQGYRLNRR
jgi:Ca-activated chloride channel family protein